MGDDEPHWRRITPAPAYPELSSDAATQLLVIGAGYSGLSTALHARELGCDVTVLEAHAPGHGASGRNAGQWLPGWVGRTPEQVVAARGPDLGVRLNTFNVAAARLVPELIRRHGIDAGVRGDGVIQVAADAASYARLEALASQWRAHGAAVSMLDRRALRDDLLTDAYLGGVRFDDGGCLDPFAYAQGLARAAVAAGARLHGHTPVVALERAGREWIARTPGHRLRARQVVVAIDAFPAADLSRALDRATMRLPVPMLCSPPLPARGRDFLPRGVPFAEMRAGVLLFGGMLDASGRWIVSATPHFWSQDRERLGRWALRRFRRVFPQVAPFEWERGWWGQIGVGRDALPAVHALDEGLYALGGYAGGGIALATAIGRALGRRLAGGDDSDLPFLQGPPRPLPLRRVLPALLRGLVFPLVRGLDGASRR